MTFLSPPSVPPPLLPPLPPLLSLSTSLSHASWVPPFRPWQLEFEWNRNILTSPWNTGWKISPPSTKFTNKPKNWLTKLVAPVCEFTSCVLKFFFREPDKKVLESTHGEKYLIFIFLAYRGQRFNIIRYGSDLLYGGVKRSHCALYWGLRWAD